MNFTKEEIYLAISTIILSIPIAYIGHICMKKIHVKAKRYDDGVYSKWDSMAEFHSHNQARVNYIYHIATFRFLRATVSLIISLFLLTNMVNFALMEVPLYIYSIAIFLTFGYSMFEYMQAQSLRNIASRAYEKVNKKLIQEVVPIEEDKNIF